MPAPHPTEVRKLVIMEYPFPGFTPPQLEGKIWWFPFHQTASGESQSKNNPKD